MGEYFFTKTRQTSENGATDLVKLRPGDTLTEHDKSLAHLRNLAVRRPGVIITHHAPSHHGLNPQHKGNGLDGAFASDLDGLIAELSVPFWVHGHTHIRKRYQIADTTLLTNCRGFDGKDLSARGFSPGCCFDL